MELVVVVVDYHFVTTPPTPPLTQTEEEKSRHLPIVFPDFDREKCNIPTTQVRPLPPLACVSSEVLSLSLPPSLSLQIKFVDFFITGLFDSWHSKSSDLSV